MFKTIDDLFRNSEMVELPRISVAAAQEVSVLTAVNQVCEMGVATAILVGNESEIKKMLSIMKINESKFKIINVDGDLEAQANVAVSLVSKGEAEVLMKGVIDTSILLKTVLKKEYGLRTGRLMSSIGVIESKYYHKLFMITDAAMNIQPNFEEKQQIVKNAIDFAHRLGISEPKVAMLAAKEKVYSKMPDTVDAMKMVELNKNGELADCMIAGPLALDTIVNREAAIMKGITSPVAGDADIIVTPDIISGNTLYKSLAFLSEIKSGGVILGAKVPIVMTSRADNEDTKFYSIMLASLIGSKN